MKNGVCSLLKRVSVTLILLGLLNSCAFSSDPSKSVEKDKERRDSEYLEQIYGMVTGAYEGKMTTLDQPARVLKAKLGLYVQEQNVGNDSNGEPILRPTLDGRVEFDIFPDYDSILKGDTDPTTGEVKLTNITTSATGTNTDGSAKPGAVIQTIHLTAQGTKLVGQVLVARGQIGNIELTKVSPVYAAPSQGDLYERYERIKKLYEPATGRFTGRLYPTNDWHIPHNDLKKGIPIIIDISIQDDPATTSGATSSILLPTLTAFYSWDDKIDPDGVVNATLNVNYRLDLIPSELIMKSATVGPNNSTYNFHAKFINANTIQGTYINQQGRTGKYILKKTSKPTEDDEERDLVPL